VGSIAPRVTEPNILESERSVRAVRKLRKIFLPNDLAAALLLHFVAVILRPNRAVFYLTDAFMPASLGEMSK
jgi:hypothetical protein